MENNIFLFIDEGDRFLIQWDVKIFEEEYKKLNQKRIEKRQEQFSCGFVSFWDELEKILEEKGLEILAYELPTLYAEDLYND